MAGEPLADPSSLEAATTLGPRRPVKEAVFPFARFPGVDTDARPRDALDRRGHGHRPRLRHAPSPRASSAPATRCRLAAPSSSRSRTPTRTASCGAVRDLADLGFRILATRGTQRASGGARHPLRAGQQGLEGRPHIVDAMKNGEAQLVFNTTEGAKALGRLQGHPPHRLAPPYSILYNFGWCRGGDSGHQSACGGHPYGGAAAVLCKRRILRMLRRRPRRLRAGQTQELSETV